MQNIGRNDPCPCGSGMKFKKCCLPNQQPTSDDLAWQRVHQMHLKLVRKLMDFTMFTYGPTGYDEAWEKFHLWQNEEPFDPESLLHPMFGPWMFYQWRPDPNETELSNEVPMNVTPAEAFMDEFSDELTPLEIEDLEENLRRPFSFYDVLECKPGAWVKAQDLLTGERFTVIEKTGSKSMSAGDLVFSKVITIQDISVFDGMAPLIFPPRFKIKLINERKDFENTDGQITPTSLRECELEMLELFWEFYETVTKPPPPILTNTDGDLMIPHKMTFSIENLEKTFEALHKLCFSETKEELLEQADYDKAGKIKAVDFPWLRKGNKQNPSWENTVLGHIHLETGLMTVEVNSKQRSKAFLIVLKKRLPKGWKLISTNTEDLQAKLRDRKKIPPTLKEIEETRKSKELNDLPEVQEFLAKMNEGHWREWPLTPLPALKGKTPVEAIMTSDGRVAVDALLTQFERDAERRPLPGQTLDTFARLRDRLGL